ncbi:50S ribosomal protein L35 [Caldanaerobacter subterraneus KAk]|uniref:50S ribosomal protein L35 n=1 Tax=Caldanaerobacter subterraneus TaxID=911092 RepID=UPI0032C10BD8
MAKIKMKTHRGAAKRFKVLKSGKVKRMKAYKSHLLTHKSSKRKRRLRKATYLEGASAKTIKHLLPYS